MELLSTTFFYNLEKTVKVYRQFFQAQLRLNGYSITLDQWLTMKMLLDFPDDSQSEIAGKVFKDKASVTRIIDLLVENGYLIKNPHPKHLKRSVYTVTPKGQKTLNELNILVPSIRAKALAGLDFEKTNLVQEILSGINSNCK